MKLNTLKPASGSKKTRMRAGRGIGSGLGKTAGRGHKGQKSRSGYARKSGFEGGQMPLQRRIPKSGFTSKKAETRAEITLAHLEKLTDEVVDLNLLKKISFVPAKTQRVKVIATGALTKPITLRGLYATAGAKAAIEAAGGKIE